MRRGRRGKRGERKKGSAGKIIKRIFISLTVLVILAVSGVYVGGMVYFKDKFFFHTTINGFDASELRVDEVEEKIAAVIEAYKIDIMERGDVTETITAEQIDYHYASKGEVSSFLGNQKLYKWPLSLKRGMTYVFESSSEYDKDKLKEAMNGLDCFDDEKVIRPKDAYIDYADNQYFVAEEVEGNLLEEDLAKALIRDGIKQAKKEVSFVEADYYQKPVKRVDDEILNSTCDKLNQCLETDLTYIFGSNTEKIDGFMVQKWLSFDEEGNIAVDEGEVRSFVKAMADKYDTLGKPRVFRTHDGRDVTIDGGGYGWEMNQDATYDYLMDAIRGGNKGETYAEFYQTALSWNNSDIGYDYVEVDLGQQHVWLYLNGTEIVSTDCVSGLASDPKRITPPGTYTLYYRESPSVLRGENKEYETKVTYWMPFNGGIGLHDANWRQAFGGNIYLTNGSHGCINLPPEAAKRIYENVYDGIPIICYY